MKGIFHLFFPPSGKAQVRCKEKAVTSKGSAFPGNIKYNITA